MRRIALIIGNSGDKNNQGEYLEGVKQDIKNYKEFLLSKIGGQWYDDEIIVSLDETKAQIQNKIITLNQNRYDFVFILFSGHGSYSDSRQCRKLYVFNESIYEDDLTYLAPRQITILDTCANIEKDEITLSLEYIYENSKFASMLKNYRKRYEDAILKCPEQQIILYSSSINESSSDDSELGGFFAYSLLKVAKNNINSELNSKEAYLSAKELVQKKTKNQQNPQCMCIKSGTILPFSIKGN